MTAAAFWAASREAARGAEGVVLPKKLPNDAPMRSKTLALRPLFRPVRKLAFVEDRTLAGADTCNLAGTPPWAAIVN